MTQHAFNAIALLGRDATPRIAEMLSELAEWLRGQGYRVSVHSLEPTAADAVARTAQTLANARIELAIAVGGDGTLLAATHLLADSGTPLLGVNVGHMGFLADIAQQHMREDVAKVLAGQYREERRFLLKGQHERSGASYHALNDIVVQKSASGRLIEFETRVDGRFVCIHRADGLIVSSPTGSTAYSLSCGGPILHPALDAIALVPISPHNLSDRPVVVSADANIDIIVARGFGHPMAQVSWDSQHLEPLTAGDTIHIHKARRTVHLLHPLSYDYFKTLRTKLNWGTDRQS